MRAQFQMVSLAELLIKTEEQTEIDPTQTYQLVTVKLWGKGVELRSEVEGIDIKSSNMYIVRKNQFILSKIDARNGAFGLIPAALDGAVVSNDFPTFSLNTSKIEPKYLNWLSKTHDFVNICAAASEGSTNRIRLKIDRFLQTRIPLPPLEEQRRIVARIEELASKIEEAQRLRREAKEKINQLLSTTLDSFFEGKRIQNKPQKRLVQDDLAVVIAGQHIMASEYNESGNGFPYITGPADFGHKTPIISRWTENPKSTAMPGDILLTVKGAGVGKINYAPDEEVSIGRQIMAIRPNQKYLSTNFAYFFILHKSKYFQSLTTATTVPGIRKSDVENLLVPLFSLQEQYEIVEQLNSIQFQLDLLQKKQAESEAELNALLPSILDKAFKGEL